MFKWELEQRNLETFQVFSLLMVEYLATCKLRGHVQAYVPISNQPGAIGILNSENKIKGTFPLSPETLQLVGSHSGYAHTLS
jgi:hypothetical protein